MTYVHLNSPKIGYIAITTIFGNLETFNKCQNHAVLDFSLMFHVFAFPGFLINFELS